MRIVHMTSVHPWRDTRIFLKMCRSLAREGHDVHLVAPRGDAGQPTVCEGVTIHPVASPRNRRERMLWTAGSVWARAAALDGDVCHFHDPELLPRAGAYQARLGVPVVYDVHEDVRLQVRDKQWIPSLARGLASRVTGWVEDRAVRRVAAVVAATPAIARRFAAHPRCAVVQNFPLLNELAPGPQEAAGAVRGRFAYVGAIAAIRGAREMVRAVDGAGPPAGLALAGQWESGALRADCAGLPGWTAVREHGFLDRTGVRDLLQSSQAGLVLFHPAGNHVASQPNKMFEYMAAGLPVIASDFPLWRSIIEGAGCGLLVDPLDPGAIGAAMRWIMDHPDEARAMGRRGRQAVIEKYNWEQEVKKLYALYEGLRDWPVRRAEAA